jgi:hypothetical protein
MISAKEAREIVEKGKYQKSQEQLKQIEKQIEIAIKNGRSSISGDGTIETANQKTLKDLGYKIETGTQYNKIYYSISW